MAAGAPLDTSTRVFAPTRRCASHTRPTAWPRRRAASLLATAALFVTLALPVDAHAPLAPSPTTIRTRPSLPSLQPLAPIAPRPLALDGPWAEGYALEHRGAWELALNTYADLADSLGSDPSAATALRLKARAATTAELPDAARAALDRLLIDYPSSPEVPGALLMLARLQRDAGDCGAALETLTRLEARPDSAAFAPYPSIVRASCNVALERWPAVVEAAQEALALPDAPRLARIDAAEIAANASLKMDDRAAGLAFYEQSLELAGTPGYRAEMLYTTASLLQALGQDVTAADRFRTVVVSYPATARAPGALDALTEMEQGATVSPYQAAVVRLNARDDEAALPLLASVDPASPNAAPAAIARARILIRRDQLTQGIEALATIAQTHPEHAGSAVMAAGSALESAGLPAEAEAAYMRLAERDPDSAQLPAALVRVGIIRYARGDHASAVEALQQALESAHQPAAAVQAKVLFWLGKAQAMLHGIDSPEARDAWTRAVAAAPATYEGLRSRDLLVGIVQPTMDPIPPTASLAPSPGELQQRDDWFIQAGTPAPEIAAAVNERLARATRLLDLGMRDEVAWEFDTLVREAVAAKDAPRLAVLGDWAAAHDLSRQTFIIGLAQSTLLAASPLDLPRALAKHSYPAGWGDLMFEAGAAQGIDPYLLFALVRQESEFNSTARSSADARGLTQVTPPTAGDIARRLEYPDFLVTDLYRPATSLQFGAWFLAQLLDQFDGHLIHALAAYNAGGGAVGGWLDRDDTDPDLFVDQIPYVETASYVRRLYQNYRLYQSLYLTS